MSQRSSQFGAMLKVMRERAGLTQERLAERASLTERTIRNLEAGVGRPRSSTVLLIADALDAEGEQRRLLLEEARRPRAAQNHPAKISGMADEAARATVTAAQATAAAASGVPAQLPLGVRGFSGRGDELAWLDSALAAAWNGTVPAAVCVVSGTAGVGKTALAVHWAHRVAGWFPDGQLYVNLRGFGASGSVLSSAAAVRGFLDGLGVSPQRVPASVDAQAALYRSLLAGRRMLIILDNARDDLPRAFRTADLWLIHAADCCSRYSSWTCCGVRY
jgi:transcriptional regulator with XRE-family HTH domain